ncbi:MAG: MBL fold metallo-hydrolase [Aquificota bacterium]|nr:MAG: MBL fold metallo-hydrolase [Aquificota bacterium]
MKGLWLFLLFVSFAFSQTKHVKDRLEQILPGVYGVLGHPEVASPKNRGFVSNAYFVETEEGVIVFDALGNYALGRELLEVIRERTKKPVRFVVVSHYHPDHFYGLSAFKKAEAVIIAHTYAYEYLSDPSSLYALQLRQQNLGKLMEGTDLVAPHIGVSTSLILRLGRESFEVRHLCPAHHQSDIIMWMPSKKVLFSGDLVFAGRVPFLGDANTKLLLSCLEELLKYEPEYLLPGHGYYIKGKENIQREVKSLIRYVEDMRQVVRRLYLEGLSLEEVQKRINEEMLKLDPSYAQMPLFFERTPANAYRVYLDIEDELLKEGK